jgi:hypothetical protein
MEFTLEPTEITKELILKKVSEENIMEFYLGVPVKKGLFRSPLRSDRTPTVSFYRSAKTGRLIYKDFGYSDHTGDFVSVVMYKFSCSYYQALQIIANDFGIITRKNLVKNKPKMEFTNTRFEETGDAVIQVEIKDFTDKELKWWNKYGITLETLNKYRVYSCKNVFLNGDLFYLHNPNKLVFGYYGGIRENIERWRIYNVGQRKYKFVSNWKSFRLQGEHMLPKTGDVLTVTKSMKDCMTLYELGIPSVAPISENLFLTESKYNKLKERFNKIVVLYDNDLAGISNMNKIRHKYDVSPIWIPRKYGAKDISDFRALYGEEKTLELIEKARNCI